MGGDLGQPLGPDRGAQLLGACSGDAAPPQLRRPRRLFPAMSYTEEKNQETPWSATGGFCRGCGPFSPIPEEEEEEEEGTFCH